MVSWPHPQNIMATQAACEAIIKEWLENRWGGFISTGAAGPIIAAAKC